MFDLNKYSYIFAIAFEILDSVAQQVKHPDFIGSGHGFKLRLNH